ncbi:MAG: glycerol-3-phosphate 1-O-acyltransferase PlsY [Thermomicrobiales bacterium]
MDVLVACAYVVGAYGAGAVPWGVILGRVFIGTDLRDHGSGSTGTTNAYRVLGWRYSVAVLVLDFLKGMLPVLLVRWLGVDGWIVAAVGVAAAAGHCWSPFIGFRGGKAMATGAGATIAMVPPLALVVIPMALIVLWTRYVSLASIIGSLIAAVGVVVGAILGHVPVPYAVGCVIIIAVILLRHRGNFERLMDGTERRLSRPTSRPRGAKRAAPS